jgi:hypothetical protein
MNQPKQQIQINVDENIGEGNYANMAAIAHSPSEIVIDFIRLMPGLPKARVQSRIIMTPQNAKSFSKALVENLKKFEEQFGEIKMIAKEEERNFGFKVSGEGGS